MIRLALFAALLSGACRVAVPPVPGQGGPAWTEYTSDHFIVWTDGSEQDARELIRVMEHLHQVIFGVSVFNPARNTKAFVIALRAQHEVRPFIPSESRAMAAAPGYPMYQPVIAMSVDGIAHDRTVATHELTHVISYSALSFQPTWFAEGLASYFESVELDEASGSLAVGAPPADRLGTIRQRGLLPVAELFACDPARCGDGRFYPTAWALYAYLANHQPDRLLRYVQRLSELDPEAQAPLWTEVFPDLTPEKLDDALSSWIRFGEIAVHRYKVVLKPYAVAKRALGDGDVYTARALLRDQHDRDGPVPAEAVAALAIDPTNVVAQMIRMLHERRFDPEVARSLASAHPDDWRAWLLVHLALKHGEEADTARARACALVRNAPVAAPKDLCRSIPAAPDVAGRH